MGTWLTPAELRERFGEARIARLSDRGDASVPDDIVDAAIADGEGEAKSILLSRYTEGELPTTTGDASQTLKRVVARFALYYLHGHYDVIPDDVKAARAAAREEATAIANGATSLLLADAPAVDQSRAYVATTRRSSDLTDQPMTMDAMRDWGR